MDLSHLTRTVFAPLVGEMFAADYAEGSVEFELLAVEPLRSNAPSEPDSSFALVFSGPLEPELQQGVVGLSHDSIGGRADLFMVPIAREEDGMRYEVIFNRA